ncbi:MAG: MFS transporter [Candidatus Bathyarchaeota archaeon]|nr:MAG: MFS transporter [Candidatus Bathyarchaeota archaeon]
MNEERGILSRNMKALYISGFTYGIAGQLWTPFWVLYIRSLGATLTQAGIVISMRYALGVVASLSGGFLSDTTGRKKLIVASGYLSLLGFVVYTLAKTWQHLLIGVIFVSLDSMRGASLNAYTAESVSSRDRAQAYAVFQTAVHSPGLIVPVIAGYVMESEGIVQGEKRLLTIAILFVVLANTIRAVFLKETLTPRQGESRRWQRIRENFNKTTGEFLGNTSLKTILAARILSAFSREMVSPFLVIYCIDNIGLTETEYGIITGFSLLALILSRLPAARFSDSHGRRPSMLIGAALYPIWTLAYFLAPSFHWLLLAAAIEPIANSFTFPARNAYIADLIPAENRAGTFGLLFSSITLSTVPAAAVGALLWENYGPLVSFGVSTTLFIIAAAILTAYLREETEEKLDNHPD